MADNPTGGAGGSSPGGAGGTGGAGGAGGAGGEAAQEQAAAVVGRASEGSKVAAEKSAAGHDAARDQEDGSNTSEDRKSVV